MSDEITIHVPPSAKRLPDNEQWTNRLLNVTWVK